MASTVIGGVGPLGRVPSVAGPCSESNEDGDEEPSVVLNREAACAVEDVELEVWHQQFVDGCRCERIALDHDALVGAGVAGHDHCD